MPKTRSWTDEQLVKAVKDSQSYRAVLLKLNLVPAGGNYEQIKHRIKDLGISIEHFVGQGWNSGWKFDPRVPAVPLEDHLKDGTRIQSFRLKKMIFKNGLKKPECELCGWAEMSVDGRVPLELDHINGKRNDNRITNLRILCPNCHSLQPTHRGKNKKVRYARVLE